MMKPKPETAAEKLRRHWPFLFLTVLLLAGLAISAWFSLRETAIRQEIRIVPTPKSIIPTMESIRSKITIPPEPTITKIYVYEPSPVPTLPPDVEPPQISIGGPKSGMQVNITNPCFDIHITDNRPLITQTILVRYKMNTDEWSPWGSSETYKRPCYRGLGDGAYEFYVQARDGAGNETPEIVRHFSIKTD